MNDAQNFMVQFGMHGDPATNQLWTRKAIKDEPVKSSNGRGTISFACAGPNTRSNQLFININDNAYLDREQFAPIGKVIHGMKYIDAIYMGYGEGGNGSGKDGKGPSQGRISREGNAYLDQVFPKLSSILKAEIVNSTP